MAEELIRDADVKTPKFSFEGHIVLAKCVKVYDGDTAHFVFVPPIEGSTLGPRRFICRMSGYNSAEMRTKDPAEKAAAVAAQAALSELIYGKIVQLSIGKHDLYGRLLVYVECGGVDVCKQMIATGHGKEYTGKGAKLWH